MTNISLTLEQQDALALLRAATNISNARALGDKAALAKAEHADLLSKEVGEELMA